MPLKQPDVVKFHSKSDLWFGLKQDAIWSPFFNCFMLFEFNKIWYMERCDRVVISLSGVYSVKNQLWLNETKCVKFWTDSFGISINLGLKRKFRLGFFMDKQQQEQGKCEQVVYVVFEGFESRLLTLGVPVLFRDWCKTWGIGSLLWTQLSYLILSSENWVKNKQPISTTLTRYQNSAVICFIFN